MGRKGKQIKVFSDGCDQCLRHIDNVEVGKCTGCNLEVLLLDIEDNMPFVEKYQVSMHPTTIIDDIIKIEGVPDFYWQCGDEFYTRLRGEYPFDLETL